MEQLIEVIKLIAIKYIDTINIILEKDLITLEYLYYINNEKDVYKTMQIRSFDGKLKITYIPEYITKIINLEELEEIILILKKQSEIKEFTSEEVKQIKQKYKSGLKIELIRMYDYINPVPPGTKGIVDFVDDLGTIHMKWQNNSTLGLTVGLDEFKILEDNL